MINVGDDRGEVTLTFTTETMEQFLEWLNESDLRDRARPEYRVTFYADEYEPGKVYLVENTLQIHDRHTDANADSVVNHQCSRRYRLGKALAILLGLWR